MVFNWMPLKRLQNANQQKEAVNCHWRLFVDIYTWGKKYLLCYVTPSPSWSFLRYFFLIKNKKTLKKQCDGRRKLKTHRLFATCWGKWYWPGDDLRDYIPWEDLKMRNGKLKLTCCLCTMFRNSHRRRTFKVQRLVQTQIVCSLMVILKTDFF